MVVARLLFSAGADLGSLVPPGYPTSATLNLAHLSFESLVPRVGSQLNWEHTEATFLAASTAPDEGKDDNDISTEAAVSPKWAFVLDKVLGPLREPPAVELRAAVRSSTSLFR
jgi:hypothetical protein